MLGANKLKKREIVDPQIYANLPDNENRLSADACPDCVPSRTLTSYQTHLRNLRIDRIWNLVIRASNNQSGPISFPQASALEFGFNLLVIGLGLLQLFQQR
jgi:hypothetical protein